MLNEKIKMTTIGANRKMKTKTPQDVRARLVQSGRALKACRCGTGRAVGAPALGDHRPPVGYVDQRDLASRPNDRAKQQSDARRRSSP